MRSIFFDNVLNVRDIGGYNSKIGTINYNKVIRGQAPVNISSLAKEKFEELNLDIIDIRSSIEKDKRKNSFEQYNNINLYKTRWPNSEKDIPVTYMEVIEDYENIKKIFEIILNTNKTVYICCGLGKDRTGVIIMLLLLLCMVKEEDIIADYALSDVYLNEYYTEYHKNNPKAPKYLGRAKPEYMRKTIRMFHDKYDSIEKYFQKVGLSDDAINKLREKMINKI